MVVQEGKDGFPSLAANVQQGPFSWDLGAKKLRNQDAWSSLMHFGMESNAYVMKDLRLLSIVSVVLFAGIVAAQFFI